MNYPWLDEYCMAKSGVTKEYKEAWKATKYLLDGKMFALSGNGNTNRAIVTLKLIPSESDCLRRQYTDIMAGYYMDKDHWSSIYLNGSVPDNILQDMIDESYSILLASLTKKRQKGITG